MVNRCFVVRGAAPVLPLLQQQPPDYTRHEKLLKDTAKHFSGSLTRAEVRHKSISAIRALLTENDFLMQTKIGGSGGGAMYGSIGGAGVLKALQLLRKCGLGWNSRLVDVGAGFGA